MQKLSKPNILLIVADQMTPFLTGMYDNQDICFWIGGIDVQQQFPYMATDEIEDEVKRTIDILAPGGGWVCLFPKP
jgi:uroporphyrinogen decarboxylase